MHDDYMAAAWDHTAMLLACWSGTKQSPEQLNPYRRRTRDRSYMRQVELHAMAQALDARNSTLAAQSISPSTEPPELEPGR